MASITEIKSDGKGNWKTATKPSKKGLDAYKKKKGKLEALTAKEGIELFYGGWNTRAHSYKDDGGYCETCGFCKAVCKGKKQ